MADVTAALLESVRVAREDMRAIARSMADATPAAERRETDEAANEQFLNAFEALLVEALEGGTEQRTFIMDTAIPALVADGITTSEMLQGHVAYFVALTPRLADGVPAEQRQDAITWLARYFALYACEVTERSLAAEREQAAG